MWIEIKELNIFCYAPAQKDRTDFADINIGEHIFKGSNYVMHDL